MEPPPVDKISPSSDAQPQQPLYFVNGAVDFLLIGGASLLVFLLLRSFHSGDRTEVIYGTAATLSWVCNWPHFAATSYRLYHSRDNLVQYPITALLIPWIILAGIGVSIGYPELVAPYFVKLFLIWSPYHFSGQTVGVTLIYARRCGFQIGKLERFALSGFVFGTFLTQTMLAEVQPGGASYYGISYPGIGLPFWSYQVARSFMWICGAGLLMFVIRWSLTNRRMLPPIVLLPAAAQYLWFVGGTDVDSFLEFVPFFHALQYMLIAWSMQLKETMDLNHIEPSGRYVLQESTRWFLINVAGGAFLFYFLPRMIASSGLNLTFVTGVVLAGVQIHHFFVDGVIWKLRRRSVASPLMVNLSQMLYRAPIEQETTT